MLTITSITVTPRQSPADAALAAAVERWMPGAEGHELQTIRDELRARGHDVLPLVREGDADRVIAAAWDLVSNSHKDGHAERWQTLAHALHSLPAKEPQS